MSRSSELDVSRSSSGIPEFPKELKGVMIAVDLSVKTPVEKLETPPLLDAAQTLVSLEQSIGYKEVVSSPKVVKGVPLERQIAGGK